ncbi:hypothetical protein ARMGADRAFT_1028390 [Armillaria gallica]|uniref:Uncharacterized protein n=1 Tax=Armillaria gallica TaxID=47427 RepID=A0A2H3DLW4_ARMGA|nr:hypothetical protein ARMGADRAFT_1028390 [Armillaria gallica]
MALLGPLGTAMENGFRTNNMYRRWDGDEHLQKNHRDADRVVGNNSESGFYADVIAAYVKDLKPPKAIAPTLLVRHISAHANAACELSSPKDGCYVGKPSSLVSGSSVGKEIV